jgi:hypothetical protein
MLRVLGTFTGEGTDDSEPPDPGTASEPVRVIREPPK